jgi:hypothetical protein
MTTRNAIYLLSLIALVSTGCHSSSQPSGSATAGTESSDPQPSSGSGSAPASASHGFTTATITDPSQNNMEAQTMTVPAGWKVQGIVITSPCTSLPSVVYRAYAADGLTEMRLTPTVGWNWSPNPAVPKGQGCLPFSGPVSAADFLKQYVETLSGGVHVVGPMDPGAAYRKAADDLAATLNANSQKFAQTAGPRMGPATRITDDVGALRIETRNGSFVIEQRLRTVVQCVIRDGGPMAGGNCTAQVDVERAPQGKLDALVKLVDSNNLPNLKMTPQWKDAEIALIQKRGQEGLAAIQHQFEVGTQAQKAMFDSFMQNTQRNHQAFMAQQESSFESSMNNAQASQNARTTAASDVIDYALDRQTVTGSNGTVHVSNGYAQTWSDGQGHFYQTENPGVNPNGKLPGNWTQDTNVHGNGQPY